MTLPSRQTVSGVLVRLTDFDVTLYDPQTAQMRSWLRNGDAPKVDVVDPLQAHLDMCPQWTDDRHAQHDGLSGEVSNDERDARADPDRSASWRLLAPAALVAQQGAALDPSTLLKPPTDSWPTYHGDYSGPPLQHAHADQRRQREEPAAGVGVPAEHVAGVRAASAAKAPTCLRPRPNGFGPPTIKSTPLMVNGMLYFSAPDHVWAVDARTGREIWHYFWKTRGGIHIGNRGVGMYGNWIYFLTPDNYFVSLDAATGKERWHHEIANVKREYFSTSAPIIIGKQVLIGVGGDSLDVPGYLESRDPESGQVMWRWYTTPRPGQPGAETLAERRRDAQRRRHALAAGHVRSGAQPLLHRHRQPAAGAVGQEPRRRQPLDVLDRRRSTRIPASSCGTTRCRRTTRTTGTPRRRPSSSTASSTASRGSCWRRPIATATSSCSIGPTASTS